ncbi:MAG: isoprenylcysteine carboxylmethyltransferase family protein [candidate division Zixibacteria bacterium]|nr:isoprenylcysteine carboxylmethyltransferase family protein [candidate division Zixibacteria bacterium]
MMNLNLLFIVISAVWISSELVLLVTKRSQNRGTESADSGSQRILWLAITLSIATGYLAAANRLLPLPGDLHVWRIAGLILIVAGLAVRWTAILALKELFTVDVAIATGQHLVDRGIYRWVRHPSYTGMLVSFLGLGIAFGSLFSVVIILIPTTLAILHRVRIEEAALNTALGAEYALYARRTRRLIPFLFLV